MNDVVVSLFGMVYEVCVYVCVLCVFNLVGDVVEE